MQGGIYKVDFGSILPINEPLDPVCTVLCGIVDSRQRPKTK